MCGVGAAQNINSKEFATYGKLHSITLVQICWFRSSNHHEHPDLCSGLLYVNSCVCVHSRLQAVWVLRSHSATVCVPELEVRGCIQCSSNLITQQDFSFLSSPHMTPKFASQGHPSIWGQTLRVHDIWGCMIGCREEERRKEAQLHKSFLDVILRCLIPLEVTLILADRTAGYKRWNKHLSPAF